jgi:peptidyl-prolyl cis-trans isomerase A (cyclophilin A)
MFKVLAIILLGIINSALNFQQASKNPMIVINTESGDITLELYADRAPVTVANFLRYIDSSMFVKSCFYRIVRADNQPRDSVRIAVIQGGRWQNEDKGFPAIQLETTEKTGIKHKDGVISMARSTPDSATSEFFICVGDQPELDFKGKRNKDGMGFAAFGRVVSGLDVVYKIHNNNAPDQYLQEKIIIKNILRLSR